MTEIFMRFLVCTTAVDQAVQQPEIDQETRGNHIGRRVKQLTGQWLPIPEFDSEGERCRVTRQLQLTELLNYYYVINMKSFTWQWTSIAELGEVY